MARRVGRFGPAPLALALTVYDVWRRLPPQQRRQLMRLAQKHGPTVAAKVYGLRRGRRNPRA
jgi:hypothetical protein